MKLVTNKFKSGGLHKKHVVATWESWEPSQHLVIDTGKPRKTCVEEKPVSSTTNKQKEICIEWKKLLFNLESPKII